MKLNGYYIIIAVALILPLLTSCRQELCYDHYPTLDIRFTWEREWERDYGQYHLDGWDSEYFGKNYDELRPDIPEWIMLVKYSDNERPFESFLKPSGGKFITGLGKSNSYLLYNGDTEYIILSDVASLNDARASATSRSRSSIEQVMERHPDARTTNPPDILYAAYIDNVPAMKSHEYKDMPINMQPLVYTYIISYEFEYGFENVALARGALGGMAESVYLRNGTTSDKTAIILFDCNIGKKGCKAEVRSFGVPRFPDNYYGHLASVPEQRNYTLNLEVMLKNGKTVEFNYDISDQLATQPRGGVIKIEGLRVEDEQSAVTPGIVVDVSGWGNHEDILLPVGTK